MCVAQAAWQPQRAGIPRRQQPVCSLGTMAAARSVSRACVGLLVLLRVAAAAIGGPARTVVRNRGACPSAPVAPNSPAPARPRPQAASPSRAPSAPTSSARSATCCSRPRPARPAAASPTTPQVRARSRGSRRRRRGAGAPARHRAATRADRQPCAARRHVPAAALGAAQGPVRLPHPVQLPRAAGRRGPEGRRACARHQRLRVAVCGVRPAGGPQVGPGLSARPPARPPAPPARLPAACGPAQARRSAPRPRSRRARPSRACCPSRLSQGTPAQQAAQLHITDEALVQLVEALADNKDPNFKGSPAVYNFWPMYNGGVAPAPAKCWLRASSPAAHCAEGRWLGRAGCWASPSVRRALLQAPPLAWATAAPTARWRPTCCSRCRRRSARCAPWRRSWPRSTCAARWAPCRALLRLAAPALGASSRTTLGGAAVGRTAAAGRVQQRNRSQPCAADTRCCWQSRCPMAACAGGGAGPGRRAGLQPEPHLQDPA